MALPLAAVFPYPVSQLTQPHGLLDEDEAAALLRSKPSTLRKWRCVGGGPRFVKIGRSVRYDLRDVQAFIDASRRSSTSDRGETA